MSNKRRVFVTMHHRGALSLGDNRQRLAYAAYHWGIFISPKASRGQDCYAYDVSDAAMPDPVQLIDRNPNRDWHFRRQEKITLDFSTSLFARAMIGKIPNRVSIKEICTLLESLPLPDKRAPNQNCVSWTRSAIQLFQENGLAEPFDLDQFMDDSLAFADRRLRDLESTPDTINYRLR